MSPADVSVAGPDLAGLKRRLADLADAAHREVATTLEQIATDVADEARRALVSPAGSGGGAGSRQASAPGHPPDDPTGRLGASLHVVMDDPNTRATVAAAAPYAIFLEYGTRTMAARPFLRPAVDALSGQARQRLVDALARAAAAAGEAS